MEPPKNSNSLSQIIAGGDLVDELFQSILGRRLGDEKFRTEVHNFESVKYWIERLISSDEFKGKFFERHGIRTPSDRFVRDADFRAPRIFPHAPPKGVLITGSCLADTWADCLRSQFRNLNIKHVLQNNASELEDLRDDELDQFSFQIAHLPTRSILHDFEFFHIADDINDEKKFAVLLERCKLRVEHNFKATLKYNVQRNIPVFVLNLAVPQVNLFGIALPRYKLSNIMYFFEELNRHLGALIEKKTGVYLVDFDGICASIGKRSIMDDFTSHVTHGSFMGNTYWAEDMELTPHGSVVEIHQPKISETVLAVYNECCSLFYAISPEKKIKLVIFDLDGTLWRGVAAEADDVAPDRLSEGWPVSLVEAASFLKQRGILLAIASKNDANAANSIWEKVYGRRFPLTNFASVKISWETKAESVRQILEELNLLPENCLLVDDNPVERHLVGAAFPEMAIIEGPIVEWRRRLLLSPELQVATVTPESASRTQSIRGMVAREAAKNGVSPQDYHASLAVKLDVATVSGVGDKSFARVAELLNKTNQFNTTGKRWTSEDFSQFFSQGGNIYAATVSDRFNDYGLTALLLNLGNECVQMVMSCRVFGLRVETELFEKFIRHSDRARPVSVWFARTGKNGPSEKFLSSLGFTVSETTDLHAPTLYRMPLPLFRGVAATLAT